MCSASLLSGMECMAVLLRSRFLPEKMRNEVSEPIEEAATYNIGRVDAAIILRGNALFIFGVDALDNVQAYFTPIMMHPVSAVARGRRDNVIRAAYEWGGVNAEPGGT